MEYLKHFSSSHFKNWPQLARSMQVGRKSNASSEVKVFANCDFVSPDVCFFNSALSHPN